ncbi:class II fructose-bisphosphate aldolase, partial [Candidatus Gracilibacteria bacterium]|nr:class II fructose-bisphosphate aldolase [Candidatus Gracilibacteria bacterium]
KHNTGDKPLHIVFHGGSGSEAEKINEAIGYGVIKMNVDTDTQWAFCGGSKKFMDDNSAYLHSQIGNPDGDDIPNKKYYDPRKFIGAGQEAMKIRILQAFKELNALNRN